MGGVGKINGPEGGDVILPGGGGCSEQYPASRVRNLGPDRNLVL